MPFQPVSEVRYTDKNPFNRKFCGCMSLRGGCAAACAIWLVSLFIKILLYCTYGFYNRV